MDEFARQVGYLAIFVAAVYAIGKSLGSRSDTINRERAHIAITFDIAKGISCRKIYQSTSDPRILGEVKRHFSDPLYLYLELDDDAYQKQLIKDGRERELEAAMKRISSEGETCRLIDGKLIFRPIKGWESYAST
ncbi:MAG: hypothetical protein IPI20_08220 [Rhodoferax sp.]|nr:hypothetical protein [Rhodoferax sp.]